jgi:hypothetical protein
MKRFTNDGRNDQEGRELIPAHRNAEEGEALDLSFEGEAGARTLSRRQAIGLLGGSLAGVSLLSLGVAAPAEAEVNEFLLPFRSFDHISLEWEFTPNVEWQPTPQNRFLDGRTQNGTVGLAPHTNPPFTGTRWEAVQRNPGTWPPSWWLRCLGHLPGPGQWLDGRTQNGSVGLAEHRGAPGAPRTGTRWEITRWTASNSPEDVIQLKCLGNLPSPEPGHVWLTGYPFQGAEGSVGLSGTGSVWKVRILPQ